MRFVAAADEPGNEPGPTDDPQHVAPRRCWGVADDGAVVEIETDPSCADLLFEYWPPLGLTRSTNPDGPVARRIAIGALDQDGSPEVSVDGLPSWGGWERVESELALFAAERLTGLVAVHAAVVVRGSKALLVPGASGVGKSSLCVAAANAGAQVLSDEYALVDPTTGLVTGWRRPVRVRREGGGVDRFDLTVASASVPVGLVALVKHDPVAGRSWAPINGAGAVLGLLANTVCAQSRPDESLDAALAIARSAAAVSGTRGEAAHAVVDLLSLLDEHSRPPLPGDG